jgi:hypothetical protein
MNFGFFNICSLYLQSAHWHMDAIEMVLLYTVREKTTKTQRHKEDFLKFFVSLCLCGFLLLLLEHGG